MYNICEEVTVAEGRERERERKRREGDRARELYVETLRQGKRVHLVGGGVLVGKLESTSRD